MLLCRLVLACVVCGAWAGAAASAASLPLVTEVELQPVRAQVQRVVQALKLAGSPLGSEQAGLLEAALALPDAGENRSDFAKILQIIHDVNGVNACNRDGAQGKALGITIPGSYQECELFYFQNLGLFYLDTILGKAQLKVRSGFLNALLSIGSVIGPSQVLGRIGDLLVGARFHPLRVMQVAATMLPVAFTILILGGGSSVAAVVFAVLYGVAIGMNTIARGAVPLALFGPVGYGARLGRMAAPAFLAEAAAPVAYAAMIGVAGAEGGFLLAAAATVGSFLAVTALSLAWRREMRAGKKK